MPLRQRPRGISTLAVLGGVIASFALASPAHAQAPAAIAVEQGYGFATVSWSAVAGATQYEIERTPLAGGQPSGPALVVGRWTADRYSAQGRAGGERTFADSGFVLGGQYRRHRLLDRRPDRRRAGVAEQGSVPAARRPRRWDGCARPGSCTGVWAARS